MSDDEAEIYSALAEGNFNRIPYSYSYIPPRCGGERKKLMTTSENTSLPDDCGKELDDMQERVEKGWDHTLGGIKKVPYVRIENSTFYNNSNSTEENTGKTGHTESSDLAGVNDAETDYEINSREFETALDSIDIEDIVAGGVEIRPGKSRPGLSIGSAIYNEIDPRLKNMDPTIRTFRTSPERDLFISYYRSRSTIVAELKKMKKDLYGEGIDFVYNVQDGAYWSRGESSDLIRALNNDLDSFRNGQDPYKNMTAEKEDEPEIEPSDPLMTGISIAENIKEDLPEDLPDDDKKAQPDDTTDKGADAGETETQKDTPDISDEEDTESVETDTIKRTYLVDSENVSFSWKQIITDNPADEIIVLYTEHTPKLTYADVSKIVDRKCSIRFEQVISGKEPGTNALDFQLVSILGWLINEHPEREYVIAARDKGYDPAIGYWRSKGINVSKLPMVNRDLPEGTTAFSSLSEEEKQKVRDACINYTEKAFHTPTAAAGKENGGKKFDRMIFLQKKLPGRKKEVYENIIKIIDARGPEDTGKIYADFIDVFGHNGVILYNKLKGSMDEYMTI